jgi:hypothetical protein
MAAQLVLAKAGAQTQALSKDHQSAAASAGDAAHRHRAAVAQLHGPIHLGSTDHAGALDLKLPLQGPEARFDFQAGQQFRAHGRVVVVVPERLSQVASHCQDQARRRAIRSAAAKWHLERTHGVEAVGSMRQAAMEMEKPTPVLFAKANAAGPFAA